MLTTYHGLLGILCFFYGVIILPLFNYDVRHGKNKAWWLHNSILESLMFLMASFYLFDLAGLSGEKHDWLFIQVLFTLGLILLSLNYLWNSGRIYFDLNKTKDEVYEYVSGCKQLIVKQVIVLVLSLFFFGRMVLILSGKSFPF